MPGAWRGFLFQAVCVESDSMKRSTSLVSVLVFTAVAAACGEIDMAVLDPDFAAFESRLEAARERYSMSGLETMTPETGRRLQGRLRDALLPPVRTALQELAESNRVVVVVDRVFSDTGRTNDVWQYASLGICPDESDRAFGRDVVFRLFSRTATSFPDYGDDFETYVFKRVGKTVDGCRVYKRTDADGDECWLFPAVVGPLDWISLPKANITWCGIDLWEIEHEDFRDGLLRRVPLVEAFRPDGPPPPALRTVPKPTDDAFVFAVQTLTNHLSAVDLAALAEEAQEISRHVPEPDLNGWPLPDSWLAPFEKALAPVCGERRYSLSSGHREFDSGSRRFSFLHADVRVGEVWLRLSFFPVDGEPKPEASDAPPSTGGPGVWAAPFLLVEPGNGQLF